MKNTKIIVCDVPEDLFKRNEPETVLEYKARMAKYHNHPGLLNQEIASIQEEDVEHNYQTFGDTKEDRLDDFWYEDSDSAIEDLERNSSVGREHFKKSRFQYFRDVDFVCEVACRSDYQNLKYCSKKMRDNAYVVYSAMFMCDEHQERLTLIYASKRLQDKVNSLVEKKKIRIHEALLIIANIEAKVNKYKESFGDSEEGQEE
ncbi:hypothetical protein [Aquitalea pelogenes]|uniref:hypothetical protein n=1 Tax=Aquitalea pelogenes TaxID=1293573 RepID=UPI0035B21F3B